MKKQKKIVLIDDDEDEWFLFREALRRIDDSLTHDYFQDAIDALRFLSDGDEDALPDFIFLDLNMPRMNGKECLLELKSKKELASIPVIILSTSDNESDISHAKSLGASYFVTKPNRLRLLEAAIHFIISDNEQGLPTELHNWVRLL